MTTFALILSLMAGMCTGLGGIVGVLIESKGKKVISSALGFSSGIMITVSLSDIVPHAVNILKGKIGIFAGSIMAVGAVCAGIFLGMLINTFIPENNSMSSNDGMYRLGMFSMISLMAHNLPEGIAVYMSGSTDRTLGISLAIAIGLHNIPEGIAVALPIYMATGNPFKGIKYAFISGLAEPLGGVIAWLILAPIVGELFLEYVMALVSGLMLYVAVNELIPSSVENGGFSSMSTGMLLGIIVMSISIYLT